MSAKWCTFKRAALRAVAAMTLAAMAVPPAGAQQADTVWIVRHDTVWLERPADTVVSAEVKHSRYDRRVHRYRRRWQALIPTHTKLQLAGGMGLLSAGTGWDYGRHNQWETDVFLGFLPKYSSRRPKMTFTVKQTYIPWSLQVKQSVFSVEPLSCGMYLNTVFGEEFWVNEPSRYPKGYYGFSSKVRIHAFVGQRVTVDIDPHRRFTAKALTFFYELGTCDLYLISAFTNRYLRPRDWLGLSFGVKLQLL